MAAQWLIVTVRTTGLEGTELARAQAGTIRDKLFKIGELVAVSLRRIYRRLSSAFPRQRLSCRALARLAVPSGSIASPPQPLTAPRSPRQT